MEFEHGKRIWAVHGSCYDGTRRSDLFQHRRGRRAVKGSLWHERFREDGTRNVGYNTHSTYLYADSFSLGGSKCTKNTLLMPFKD